MLPLLQHLVGSFNTVLSGKLPSTRVAGAMGFLESSSGSDASDSDRETKKRGSRSSGVQPGLSKRDSETLQVNEKFAKR